MTLKELWLLVKHYWKVVVTVPVLCLVACGAYLLATSQSASYTATSRIVVNSQTAAVAGIASSEARLASDKEAGLSAAAKADTGTMTVTVTVKGSDLDECVALADGIAERAVATARDFYEESEGSDYKTPFKAIVDPADPAEAADSASLGSKVKFLLASLLGGLFLAVCAAVAVDLKRRHVKTPEGAQEATGLPVLEVLPAKDGGRLLANVRFASKAEEPRAVLVVPTGDVQTAEKAGRMLQSAAADAGAGVTVSCSEPLAQSMQGAYDAREADAVVVACRQWADSLPQLESTVAELALAGADVCGIVYAEGRRNRA